MRVTAEHPFARFIDIYLDGIKQSGVVEADEETGVIEVTPAQVGRHSGPPGRITGKVEIRVRENDDGMTRELLEAIERWGDLHTATAAMMFGERFLQADELGRRAMRADAKARRFMYYGVRPKRLGQLLDDSTVKTATPAEMGAFAGLPPEKIEVVLMAAQGPGLRCRLCNELIVVNERAWHAGVDLSAGWTCRACQPEWVTPDSNSAIDLCKEIDAIQSEMIASLGIPADRFMEAGPAGSLKRSDLAAVRDQMMAHAGLPAGTDPTVAARVEVDGAFKAAGGMVPPPVPTVASRACPRVNVWCVGSCCADRAARNRLHRTCALGSSTPAIAGPHRRSSGSGVTCPRCSLLESGVPAPTSIRPSICLPGMWKIGGRVSSPVGPRCTRRLPGRLHRARRPNGGPSSPASTTRKRLGGTALP